MDGILRSLGTLTRVYSPGWFTSNFAPLALTRCGSPVAVKTGEVGVGVGAVVGVGVGAGVGGTAQP